MRKKNKIDNCELCNKEFEHYSWDSQKYCSRDCYNFRNGIQKKLKRGTAYYKDLLNKSSCECGETKPYLLQIHHIDGNHNNNDKDNLEIVCPTCHVKRHLKKNKLNEWVYHPKSLTDRNLLKDI